MPLEMLTDATAAMGIARRLGVGRIRHLDTSLLWIQAKVRDKELHLSKIAGKENPGDCLTKYLSGPEIKAHLARMGLYFAEGRAETAPKLQQ